MTVAVLLNSGGLDSRVAAAAVQEFGWELHSLFVDYDPQVGDAHEKAAQATADAYCKSHTVFPFPMTEWFGPMRVYPDRVNIPYPVPFFLTVGAQYAAHLGAEYVVTGFHDDVPSNPNVRDYQQYLNNRPLGVKGGKTPVFWQPLEGIDQKTDVILRGAELGVDMVGVVYCMFGAEPCGKCNNCRIVNSAVQRLFLNG